VSKVHRAPVLGWEEIPVTVVDLDRVVRGEYAENMFRKAFTPTEIGAIAQAIAPLERAAAKERQQKAGERYGRGKEPIASGKFPEAIKGRARDQVGKVAGVSGKTIERILDVIEAADEDNPPPHHLHTRVSEDGEVARLAQARMLGVTPSAALREAITAWVADEETTPAVPDETLKPRSVLSRGWRRRGRG
jgi:ParB-like chromosome segregation protein Spo0J